MNREWGLKISPSKTCFWGKEFTWLFIEVLSEIFEKVYSFEPWFDIIFDFYGIWLIKVGWFW